MFVMSLNVINHPDGSIWFVDVYKFGMVAFTKVRETTRCGLSRISPYCNWAECAAIWWDFGWHQVVDVHRNVEKKSLNNTPGLIKIAPRNYLVVQKQVQQYLSQSQVVGLFLTTRQRGYSQPPCLSPGRAPECRAAAWWWSSGNPPQEKQDGMAHVAIALHLLSRGHTAKILSCPQLTQPYSSKHLLRVLEV